MIRDKKDSADDVIKRSIEIFGLSPQEISDSNVEWMRRNGYTMPYTSNVQVKPIPIDSKLKNFLRRLGIIGRVHEK